MLLLPVSFGPCSTSLLHVLNLQLQRQVDRTGRPGFRLHVLHVEKEPSGPDVLQKLKERYPEHTYSMISLSDPATLNDVAPLFSSSEGTDMNLATIMSSLTSVTSQTDVTQILLRKVVVGFAKAHACEAILWGDSTTRLAERTLAETAKGRGSSLPWIMADGKSVQGVPFYYPMRDLLNKEVASYVSLQDPPLDDLVVKDDLKPSVSTKNTTIDDLMRQYFQGVERDFPSIVANVVRTTSKLDINSLANVEDHCELCDMPLNGQAPERSRLCYGCIRTLPQAAG